MNINFAIQDQKKVDTVYIYTNVEVTDVQYCIQIGYVNLLFRKIMGCI